MFVKDNAPGIMQVVNACKNCILKILLLKSSVETNSVDPDQTATTGCTLFNQEAFFVIIHMRLCNSQ